jgi:hypothetical protein
VIGPGLISGEARTSGPAPTLPVDPPGRVSATASARGDHHVFGSPKGILVGWRLLNGYGQSRQLNMGVKGFDFGG